MLTLIHVIVDGENRVGSVDTVTARQMYDAKLLSLVDGIYMPQEFVEFSSDWHDGQSSMLYAVASSSGLRRGNRRPMTDLGGDRPMTDLEWYRHIWIQLGYEVRKVQQVTHNPNEYALAGRYLAYINNVVDNVLPPVIE